MFADRSGVQAVEMLPGVERRTLAEERLMMLCEITLKKGATVPMHDHPHEQVGYVVSGRIRMMVEGGGTQDCVPGDAYALPGGVRHGAEALEDTVVIDVFSPPRDEYR